MSISISNLSFSYYNYSDIFNIKNISLTIDKPSTVCIMGPNGSGKSTFLKTLVGLNTPYTGNILVDSTNIKNLSRLELAQKIAFVPQEVSININLRVLDIVAMGRYPYQTRFSFESAEDTQICKDSLKLVGMDRQMHTPFLALSGGEKQRILIARALAQKATLLLLDEPTAFLDIASKINFFKLLTELKEKQSIISLVVTHELHLASSFADSILLLDQGEIFAHGSPKEALTKDNLEKLFKVEFKDLLTPKLF